MAEQMSRYECEGCRQVYTSYRAMMLCEEADYADTVAARRAHTIPRIMRPASRWEDD